MCARVCLHARAQWYLLLSWLPKYLHDVLGIELKSIGFGACRRESACAFVRKVLELKLELIDEPLW